PTHRATRPPDPRGPAAAPSSWLMARRHLVFGPATSGSFSAISTALKKGLPMPLDETRDFIPLNIAVMTVSDTRTPEDDKSGDVLAERIEKAGHNVAVRRIVPDDKGLI